MLSRAFRVARSFASQQPVNMPGYLATKRQVELDKYLRDHKDLTKRLHPDTKKRYNRLSLPPAPLKYKLHPEPQKLDFLQPLGLTQEIPWAINRTKSENLPVYRRYSYGRTQNYTEIRHIEGDIEVDSPDQDFCAELQKVVSHQEIEKKVGRVRVKGLHKESVLKWLYLLGF